MREHHNNHPYILEAIEEADTAIRKIKGLEKENDAWFKRIDEAIDEIAHHLRIDVPYSTSPENKYLYNAAYRTERLLQEIQQFNVVTPNMKMLI